jgi:hypothetical protein
VRANKRPEETPHLWLVTLPRLLGRHPVLQLLGKKRYIREYAQSFESLESQSSKSGHMSIFTVKKI